MIRTRQQEGLGRSAPFSSLDGHRNERSFLRPALLYPAVSLLLVVLLFQITGRQMARAEEALARYREEAIRYRQTAAAYQAALQALKREERLVPPQALRALLEQQAAGHSYD